MDCRAKIISKGLFVLLLIPTLIWGYGKAVFQIAQISDDSTIDGSIDGEAKTPPADQGSVGPVQAGSNPVIANSAVPVQAGQSSESEVATTAEIPEEPANTGKSNANETAPGRAKTESEPDLTSETYNQVRVRKPSIPDRFGSGVVHNRANGQESGNSPLPLMGLLGIPTLVFSLLFFVMWGIISGRIQRIMF